MIRKSYLNGSNLPNEKDVHHFDEADSLKSQNLKEQGRSRYIIVLCTVSREVLTKNRQGLSKLTILHRVIPLLPSLHIYNMKLASLGVIAAAVSAVSAMGDVCINMVRL